MKKNTIKHKLPVQSSFGYAKSVNSVNPNSDTYASANEHPFNPLYVGRSQYEDPKGATSLKYKKNKVLQGVKIRSGRNLQGNSSTEGMNLQGGNFAGAKLQGSYRSLQGNVVGDESPTSQNLFKKHRTKVKNIKYKLGLKGKLKSGDMLKAYKKQVVTKGKFLGETDINNKVIRINKKKHGKTNPKYPELADSIQHELLHAKYPNMGEKKIEKKTAKSISTMGKKQKSKLYSMFNK